MQMSEEAERREAGACRGEVEAWLGQGRAPQPPAAEHPRAGSGEGRAGTTPSSPW